MITTRITTHCHDLGLVPKTHKSVLETETTAVIGSVLSPPGPSCTGETGLFIRRKGLGKKALRFLQQAFCSNIV